MQSFPIPFFCCDIGSMQYNGIVLKLKILTYTATRVLMGLSLIPRLSGERSSGAMHDWFEGLVGLDSLLDEELKCGCL